MHHWSAVAPAGTEKAAALTEMYSGANKSCKRIRSSVFIAQGSIALSYNFILLDGGWCTKLQPNFCS